LIGPDFDLSVWIITEWTGHPTNRDLGEHDEIVWLAPVDIARVRVAHSAYRPILHEALRSRG